MANCRRYYLIKNNRSKANENAISQFEWDNFITHALDGTNYGRKIGDITVHGISSNNIGQLFDSYTLDYTDGDKQYYRVNIPIHLWFISSIPKSESYTVVTNFDSTYKPNKPKPAFIICILTHHIFKTQSKINLKQLEKSIIAPEYFLRTFSYKEFSIDIFNHIYQPQFITMRDRKQIEDMLQQYMINLSSVASIYTSDPVNKRLLGLPSFSLTIHTTDLENNDISYTFEKEYPDMYKILQSTNMTYRKVVYSKEKNPFAV